MSKVYLQEKITGTEGQVVMINASGEAEARTETFGFTPQIVVTVAAGSAVTCTDGTTTLEATAVAGKATFDIPGYGTWTVTATLGEKSAEGQVVVDQVKRYEIELSYEYIYGVTWDGTGSTLLSRTDDAAAFADPVPAVNNGNGSSPFDTLMPWAGMQRVTDSVAGELVSIPKYWYKWEKSGVTMTLRIADHAVDGYHVSPAHADRGDGAGERDVVYVGRYNCNSAYKSVTGVTPVEDITRATARSNIHNLGSNIWQYDFAMFWTIRMLYLVEYANWDSQAAIGYGCGNNSATQAMGYTDAMVYHTGTSQANRETYGLGTQYRYIEGLWDNVYDWTDGIYFSGANIYIINNPANFSDTGNGTLVGTRLTSSGSISAWSLPSVSGLEWALYPSAVAGSETTYCADSCFYGSSGVVFFSGGYYSQGRPKGMFCLSGGLARSSSYGYVGCRLQKLP